MLEVFDFGLFLQMVIGGNGRWKVDSSEFVDELCELGMCSRAVEDLQLLDGFR